MPQMPQVDEVWKNDLTGAFGIVLRVDGTIVHFVSVTGMRAPIQFDRQYTGWTIAKPAPVLISCAEDQTVAGSLL